MGELKKTEKIEKAKKRIAVLFGGRSVEHDVSILTGIQTLEALDSTLYEAFPIYIAPNGEWFAGDGLRLRSNYLLSDQMKKKLYHLQPVRAEEGGKLRLEVKNHSFFSCLLNKPKFLEADFVIPALHGGSGENGNIQGFLEFLDVPYMGARPMMASIAMDKYFSKEIFKAKGIPTLDAVLIDHSAAPYNVKTLKDRLKNFKFPLCVKPNNLGSSVGVAKVDSIEELQVALSKIFEMDKEALIEAYVPNLTEYNIAVTKALGELRVSVIERPIADKVFLSFKDKYLASGGSKTKLGSGSAESSELMSRNRIFNPPELTAKEKSAIEKWAKEAFETIRGCGACRIDFLCNGKTREIWLNEINSYPGSLAFYLWEAADEPIGFTELLTALIEEGEREYEAFKKEADPTIGASVIFER